MPPAYDSPDEDVYLDGRNVSLIAKAADRGVKDSQYNLGVMYARGLGRQQDLPLAYRWFALAAQQGDKIVALKRLELRRKAIEKWDGRAPAIGQPGIPFMEGKL